MPMQLDGITLTADDHGAGRAAVERPPLPVDPARAARDADGAASQLVALLHSGPDPGWPRSAVTPSVSPRPVLRPLLIGAKRKEQP